MTEIKDKYKRLMEIKGEFERVVAEAKTHLAKSRELDEHAGHLLEEAKILQEDICSK